MLLYEMVARKIPYEGMSPGTSKPFRRHFLQFVAALPLSSRHCSILLTLSQSQLL